MDGGTTGLSISAMETFWNEREFLRIPVIAAEAGGR